MEIRMNATAIHKGRAKDPVCGFFNCSNPKVKTEKKM